MHEPEVPIWVRVQLRYCCNVINETSSAFGAQFTGSTSKNNNNNNCHTNKGNKQQQQNLERNR